MGDYVDAAGTTHGYVLDGGDFTTLDAPGATTYTGPWDINNRGEIVGEYDTEPPPERRSEAGEQIQTLDQEPALLGGLAGSTASREDRERRRRVVARSTRSA